LSPIHDLRDVKGLCAHTIYSAKLKNNFATSVLGHAPNYTNHVSRMTSRSTTPICAYAAILLMSALLMMQTELLASTSAEQPSQNRRNSNSVCDGVTSQAGSSRLNKRTNNAAQLARTEAFARCIEQGSWQAGINQFVNTSGWIATPAWGISRPLVATNPNAAGQASVKFTQWRVAHQRISKQGDVIVQTGQWAYQHGESHTQAQTQGQTHAHAQNTQHRGNFLLVWQQSTNEPMRIAFGLLTDNATMSPSMPPESAIATSSQTIAGRKGDALTLAEIQFGGICGASGMSTAFDVLADNDIAVLRTGLSLQGKALILADPRTKTERWRYIAQSSAIDAANEIAYVFGRYSMSRGDGKTERGYFARVWKSLPNTDAKDSANWRVIIDAATPQSAL
jgi:hypothetical protein